MKHEILPGWDCV